MEAVRSRGHMDMMGLSMNPLSLIYLPVEFCIMGLVFIDQLLSDILLSLGRPTPSQCAVCALSHHCPLTCSSHCKHIRFSYMSC